MTVTATCAGSARHCGTLCTCTGPKASHKEYVARPPRCKETSKGADMAPNSRFRFRYCAGTALCVDVRFL